MTISPLSTAKNGVVETPDIFAAHAFLAGLLSRKWKFGTVTCFTPRAMAAANSATIEGACCARYSIALTNARAADGGIAHPHARNDRARQKMQRSSVADRPAPHVRNTSLDTGSLVFAQLVDTRTASANLARILLAFLVILKRPRLHFFEELFR